MAIDIYILDDKGRAVPCADREEFCEWFDIDENRFLMRDELGDGVSVSTVFLGFDHNLSGRGPPVLWETMIFGGPHDEYQQRYTSSDAAKKGHIAAVALAKEGHVADDKPQADDKLRTCPLCRGDAILFPANPSVACSVCGCEVWGDTIGEAVTRWNSRALQS